MNNKVVWVFGCSASGKETFIKSMLLKNDIDIIDQLGWNDKQILVINESISYIKQYEEDPIGDKRIDIIDKVIELNKLHSNSIILIKGQNIDFDNNLIYRLKEKLLDVDYEIIYLFSDLNTIFERAKRKEWFTKEDDNIDDWHNHIVESSLLVKKINSIKIIPIDSTSGFEISSFPIYDKH